MPQGINTIVASAARTTTGNSGALTLGYSPTVNFQVTTTAVSGTSPSMTLSLLWSNDGVNFGAVDTTPDAFAAITAAGTVTKQAQAKGLYLQINWAITGTSPSFTFFIIAG